MNGHVNKQAKDRTMNSLPKTKKSQKRQVQGLNNFIHRRIITAHGQKWLCSAMLQTACNEHIKFL